MYPVLKEGVSLGTFQYEGSDTVHYYIENADGEEYEVSERLWDALLKADGTRPLDLPDRGEEVLPKLERHGMVRTSRFVRDGGGMNRFILFPIGDGARKGRRLCRGLNAALPAASLGIFLLGLCLLAFRGVDIEYEFSWWLYYLLSLASLALHEVGHLVAGLAYGYRIRDTGILLLGVLPIGAYVSHEVKEDAERGEEIQFSLAGVEVDLLMAGVLLLAAAHAPQSLTVMAVANTNVILAAVNLLPASGLDGEAALSAVFEVESISDVAKSWLLRKRRRRRLRRLGLPGHLAFCIFALILLSEVLFWLLIAVDCLSVLLGILAA